MWLPAHGCWAAQGVLEVRSAVNVTCSSHLPSVSQVGVGPHQLFSSHGNHTAWIFSNKLSFTLFVPISLSIPNILKFQHHLEVSK